MSKRFVFVYAMKENAPAIRDTVPAHVAYWKQAALDGYMGGPFADRSGGVITFLAADLAAATAIAEKDPFVERDLLRDRFLKEWLAG